MGDTARRFADRLNHSLVPEKRAVRPVVADQNPRRLALLYRLFDLLARFLVLIRPLQHAQVGSQQCSDWIAAHLGKSGIGVDDGMIGYCRVTDHDTLGGTVHDTAPRLGGPVVLVWSAFCFFVGVAVLC